MAMMRARAAAAAGKSAPSSGDPSSSSSATGPVKGTPIEMTLYRVAAQSDPVWKQTIKIPDVLFHDARNKGKAKEDGQSSAKQQETCRVLGMQYSPDGRVIALHIHLSHKDATTRAITQAIDAVALYAIDDGNLLALTPISTSTTNNPPLNSNLTWTTLPPAPRSRPRHISHSAAVSSAAATAALAANFVTSATSGSGPGANGLGRFQHLMGGSGAASSASSSSSNATSALPSQRILTADSPARGGTGQDEDLMRGWASLAEETQCHTCLLVPSTDDNGAHGIALLMQGRVFFAFVPFAQHGGSSQRVLASRVNDGQVQAILLHRQDSQSLQAHILATGSSPRYLSSLSTLDSILTLSSTLSQSFAQALDLTFLLKAVYRTLKAPVQPAPSSLSTHQVTALPPLTRFIYTLACVGANFSQDVTAQLVLSTLDGSPSEMVETLLLNALVEGKAAQMQTEIKGVYEVIEAVASELARLLDSLGTLLNDLRGWTAWKEQSADFFASSTGEDVVLTQLKYLKHIRTLTHHLISYSQGERLAWDEWSKWLVWERNRLESLKTSEVDPMDPTTFDPLVVVELIRRRFISTELDWIVCGVVASRDKQPQNEEEDDEMKGDDSEESFVKQERTESEGSKQVDEEKEPPAVPLDQVHLPESLTEPKKLDLQPKMAQTLSWLDDEIESESTAAGAEQNATDPLSQAQTHTAYHHLFESGPRTQLSNRATGFDNDVFKSTPYTIDTYMRKLTHDVKAMFMGMPGRLSAQEESTKCWVQEIMPMGLSLNVGQGVAAKAGVASLPVPLERSEKQDDDDVFEAMAQRSTVAYSGDYDLTLAIPSKHDGHTFYTAALDDSHSNSQLIACASSGSSIGLLDDKRAVYFARSTLGVMVTQLTNDDGAVQKEQERREETKKDEVDLAVSATRGLAASLHRLPSDAQDATATAAVGTEQWAAQTLNFWDVK